MNRREFSLDRAMTHFGLSSFRHSTFWSILHKVQYLSDKISFKISGGICWAFECPMSIERLWSANILGGCRASGTKCIVAFHD